MAARAKYNYDFETLHLGNACTQVASLDITQFELTLVLSNWRILMSDKLVIINAFTHSGAGGNPAGVVLNADNLTRDEKQSIARDAGLSETAFVSKSTIADFKLEFFTPTKQIPHCGHATIATFSYLAQQGILKKTKSSKETIDGIREIFLDNGKAYMEQGAPQFSSLPNEAEILDAIGIDRKAILPGVPIKKVNTGNSFLIIPLASVSILKQLKPNFDLIAQISDAHQMIGFYPFALVDRQEFDATARMFAPSYGITEESATGMAAGPLACYLHDVLGNKKTEFFIEQGAHMTPPSKSSLHAKLTVGGTKIEKLFVGGSSSANS